MTPDIPTAGSNHETLTIQGLSKYFAGLRALDGVSFDLTRGEILGLIGPNGSGKTTLINVVTGLLPATSGQVFVDGAEITNKKPYQMAHAGLARTFQTIRLFRELTVLENVEVAAVSMGLSRREARQRALEVLEEIGIARWAEMRAGVLPYGLERRVEVARALATQPKFLFLDEPAAGLNEDESEELLQVLAAIPATKEPGHADRRSRHAPDHAPVPPAARAELWQDHRRRHARGSAQDPGGAPGLPGQGRGGRLSMLELKDIHARYGAITALRGVSIEVSQGELVALLGVNGAGKSTTLALHRRRAASPGRGASLFEGSSILGKSPEQIARLGISLVPEGRDIFPSLTVEENLRLGAFIRKEKNEYKRNLEEVFELFPVLKERLQQPGGTLSGGEQQQLAIARALMSSPRLLMLDEPSLGLAPALVDQIFELIARLHQRGVTILLVEQNVERTLEIVDRAYLMNTGLIESQGTAAAAAQPMPISKASTWASSRQAKNIGALP